MKNIPFLVPFILAVSACPAFAIEKCPELVKVEDRGETTYWTASELAGEYPLSMGDSVMHAVDVRYLKGGLYTSVINKTISQGIVTRDYAKEMAKSLTQACAAELGNFVFDIPSVAEVRSLESLDSHRKIFQTSITNRTFLLKDRKLQFKIVAVAPPWPVLSVAYYNPKTKIIELGSDVHYLVRYRAARK